MSLFETTININHNDVERIVKENWNITLGKIIKASQNHTFQSIDEVTNIKYAVRVTPDNKGIKLQRIKDELYFVNYLNKESNLHQICAPIKSINNELLVYENNLIISVFYWAKGKELDFMSFQWLKDQRVIQAWGCFFAELHIISKKFTLQYPDVSNRIQRWDQIHNSIMKDTKLHIDDENLINHPDHYGVIHGDLNCSNFYYIEDAHLLSVFDWDQTQQGFYLADVSQAIFTVVMLIEAGLPIAGTPVPEANYDFFSENIIKGYESVAGPIDRDRLSRMIDIKKLFYKNFCQQALIEGNIPDDMNAFIVYINNWLGE